MTRSTRAIVGALSACLFAPCSVSGEARADAPHVVWIAGTPDAEVLGRARRWSRRVARALEAAGAPVTSEAERWAFEPSGTEISRVARLASVEDLLRRAHEARAGLEQGRALGILADADRAALAALDVPGATAWYAEVQIALAVTAAEASQMSLAEAALARSSTVDPGRRLGAAEAPPDLVARAETIARAIATGPRGRFELRTSIDGASIWLDGRNLGASPLRIETSVGAHVLRVEAPGHRTWARLIDVLEGGRPPIEIALAPEPGLEAARALRIASDAGAVDRVLAALAALEALGRAPRALWLVETSEGAIDRAIVVACRPGACSEPIRVDAGRVESVMPDDPEEPGAALRSGALADAREWLDEPIPIEAPPPPGTPLWEEPWPWVIAGIVAASAIGVAVGVTWPQSPDQLRIVIDGTEPFER